MKDITTRFHRLTQEVTTKERKHEKHTRFIGDNMKKVIYVFLLIGLCSLLSAQQLYSPGSSSSDKPSFGTYAAEFGGALLTTAGCYGLAAGTYLLIFEVMFKEGDYFSGLQGVAYGTLAGVAIIVGTPASSAYGVTKVGEKFNQDGSYWASFWGASCGLLVGAGISYAIARNSDKVIYYVIPSTFIGKALGAVVGYNLGRPRNGGFGYHNTRFDLPSIGLRSEKTEDGKTITALDFKLINARF